MRFKPRGIEWALVLWVAFLVAGVIWGIWDSRHLAQPPHISAREFEQHQAQVLVHHIVSCTILGFLVLVYAVVMRIFSAGVGATVDGCFWLTSLCKRKRKRKTPNKTNGE